MNNFITNIINEDITNNIYKKIVVRFPPEPNGYLHLGHVKSIVLNSTLAEIYNGELNLRFDDTNPEKENEEYVNAIKNDAFWLAHNFTRVLWASDYFDTIYDCAILLINKGLAYVDDSSIDEIRSMRGDFNHKGIESPFRNRTIDENLSLFEKMKAGDFANGEKEREHPFDEIVESFHNVFDKNQYFKIFIAPKNKIDQDSQKELIQLINTLKLGHKEQIIKILKVKMNEKCCVIWLEPSSEFSELNYKNNKGERITGTTIAGVCHILINNICNYLKTKGYEKYYNLEYGYKIKNNTRIFTHLEDLILERDSI